jgi:CBS domain-containing protein
METCNDVMTKDLVWCLRDENVVRAAKLMKKQNIGSIPVIQNEMTRTLVGMVTDRDLALEVVAEGRDPKTVRVEDVMSRGIVTCYPEDDVYTALNAMAKHQLRRIPVVNYENKIVGIIAQADIATRINEPEKTAAVVKEISR